MTKENYFFQGTREKAVRAVEAILDPNIFPSNNSN